jgi:PKD repeat protein
MKIVNKLFFILISMIFLSTIALATPATDTNTLSRITPSANFYIIPSSTNPLAISFIDQSTGSPITGSPISWSWNFGDGGTSTIENPLHTYISDGQYTVTLKVKYYIGSETTTVILTL